MVLFKINNVSLLLKLPTFLSKPAFVNYGYQEDDPKLFYKDLLFKDSPLASVSVLSEEISIKQYFKEISNQYAISSCTSNACCDSLESMVALRKGIDPSQVPNFSRMFLYWIARNNATPPATSIDKGCQIRLAMDCVRRNGVCKETTCPYDSTYLYKQPGFLAFKEAIQNKISAFYRIETMDEDERFEQILKALNNKNPIVFGIMLYSGFKTAKDNVLSPNINSETALGSHAMVITGWSKSKGAFEIRNSWGPEFGVNGYCYMAKDYILGSSKDIWVPTI